jgi:hypothetical protein
MNRPPGRPRPRFTRTTPAERKKARSTRLGQQVECVGTVTDSHIGNVGEVDRRRIWGQCYAHCFRKFFFTNFWRLSQIFCDFHQFWAIFTDFGGFSPIFGDFHQFLGSFTNFSEKLLYYNKSVNF